MATERPPWEGDDEVTLPRGRLFTNADCEKFMLAGNATITLVSGKTLARYTFKVQKPDDFKADRPIWFVNVLMGSDNERDFKYIGQIKQPVATQPPRYERGRKCWQSFYQISDIFMWASRWMFEKENMPTELEVWHEGRCGRCGRKLTVPESIESGFGPECINYV